MSEDVKGSVTCTDLLFASSDYSWVTAIDPGSLTSVIPGMGVNIFVSIYKQTSDFQRKCYPKSHK